MPHITAETANGTVEFDAEEDKKLVLAIEDQGIDILHRCGGNARCTTCRVELISGEAGEMREPEEAILATKADLEPNTRLSCQIRIHSDLHVKFINQANLMVNAVGQRPVG